MTHKAQNLDYVVFSRKSFANLDPETDLEQRCADVLRVSF